MENINDMENVCMRMSEREEFVDDEKKRQSRAREEENFPLMFYLFNFNVHVLDDDAAGSTHRNLIYFYLERREKVC